MSIDIDVSGQINRKQYKHIYMCIYTWEREMHIVIGISSKKAAWEEDCMQIPLPQELAVSSSNAYTILTLKVK